MEEENCLPAGEDHIRYCSRRVVSPEIVEIGEDSRSIGHGGSRDLGANDVYVAVGRDDLDVVKWALDHAVSPGARLFLIHVFPPITYIPTPVGRLARSQLSQEQVRVYINEQNNRKRNLLQKYIRLCNDAKVTVDTVLLESNETAKAILELIPVLNITNLVMGTKRPPSSRPSWKKLAGGEFVKKNAPDFCEVAIVHDGKKVMDGGHLNESVQSSLASTPHRSEAPRQAKGKLFECICFSGLKRIFKNPTSPRREACSSSNNRVTFN